MSGRYRYPGVNSFTRTDEDIFCGRSDDAKKLLTRLMLGNTLVLHGESGQGKSSLVQAGLLPELVKYNELLKKNGRLPYLPVTIKMDEINKTTSSDDNKKEKNALIASTLEVIKAESQPGNIELPLLNIHPDDFWYVAKLLEKKGYSLLLIFDQFEEMQGFSSGQVKSFAEKLSELFVSTMPEGFYKEYDQKTKEIRIEEMTDEERNGYSEDIRFLEQRLSTRLLFVVREDKLGTMSMLRDYFPDILKNDFFLLPLSENNARLAISEPCKKEGDFISNRFTIEGDAVDALIENLRDKKKKDNFYDPIELQIVCRSVEKKILNTNQTTITKDDLPQVDNAIRDFYNETWDIIREKYKLNDKTLIKIKRKIIDELVVNEKRNLVHENLLISEGNIWDENIIKSLEKEGLLRKIPSGNDTFYQLPHDRMIKPLTEDLLELKAKERTQQEIQQQKSRARRKMINILVWASVLLSLAAFIAIYYAIQAKKEEEIAEQEKYLLISTSLKRAGNPTLSYVIARDWQEKNPKSEIVSKYLSTFDTANYVYLAGIYPSLSEVVSVNINEENRLTINEPDKLITDEETRSVWDIEKGIMIERKKTGDHIPVIRVWVPNGQLFDVFKTGDFITISDDKKKEIVKLKTGHIKNLGNIALAPDSRYVLVDTNIFSSGTSKMIGSLPPYTYKDDMGKNKTYKQNTALFLSNTRLAAAYENGDILIYEIKEKIEKIKNKISSIDTFKSQSISSVENGIITMAFDTTQQYLFAANSQNGIDVWDLDTSRAKDPERDAYFGRSRAHVAELTGHTGLVKCMAFSSDNKLLLSGSSDYTAILWSIPDRKRIATLKGPNASEIENVCFSNHDKDIITVSKNNSEDYKVYLWKRRELPSALYEKNQLYRFSPFDYYVWGLNETKDGRPRDTSLTRELYKATLNYYLNIPEDNEYPDEESYNHSLMAAFADVKIMYDDLTSRKDYHKDIFDFNKDLLYKYYYDFLPQIEKDIVRAKSQITEWRKIISDANSGRKVSALIVRFNLITNKYIDKKINDTNGLRLIKFYIDSLLQPLTAQYDSNAYLLKLRRSIDVWRVKYYLYTGKYDEALKVAIELPPITSANFKNEIYLIAAYLATDKYSDAAKLYRDRLKTIGTYYLRDFLIRLKEKNIAVSNIDKFIKEFRLKSPGDEG